MAKIIALYTEIKEMYKNLKTNQNSNFFYCKNSSRAKFVICSNCAFWLSRLSAHSNCLSFRRCANGECRCDTPFQLYVHVQLKRCVAAAFTVGATTKWQAVAVRRKTRQPERAIWAYHKFCPRGIFAIKKIWVLISFEVLIHFLNFCVKSNDFGHL